MIEKIKRFVNEHHTLIVVIIGALVICFFYWWFCCKDMSLVGKIKGGINPNIISTYSDKIFSVIGNNCIPSIKKLYLVVLNGNGVNVIIQEAGIILSNGGLSTSLLTESELQNMLGNPTYYLFKNPDFVGNSTLYNLFGRNQKKINDIMKKIDKSNNFDLVQVLNDGGVNQEYINKIISSYSDFVDMILLYGNHAFSFIDFIGQKGNEVVIDLKRFKKEYTIKKFDAYTNVNKEAAIIELNNSSNKTKSKVEKKTLYRKDFDDLSEKTELGKYLKDNYSSTIFKSLVEVVRNWYILNLDWYCNFLKRYKLNKYGMIEIVDDEKISNEQLIYNFIAKHFIELLIKSKRDKDKTFQKDSYDVYIDSFNTEIKSTKILNIIQKVLVNDERTLGIYKTDIDNIKKEKADDETIDHELWNALIVGFVACVNRLKKIMKIKKAITLKNKNTKQLIEFKFNCIHDSSINKSLSNFNANRFNKLFDVADIYPAQKVIMLIIYVCKFFEFADFNKLKEGMAAFIIYVHLFNSFCACHMEHSWNRSINNEYVYNIFMNEVKRTEYSMDNLFLRLNGKAATPKINSVDKAKIFFEGSTDATIQCVVEACTDIQKDRKIKNNMAENDETKKTAPSTTIQGNCTNKSTNDNTNAATSAIANLTSDDNNVMDKVSDIWDCLRRVKGVNVRYSDVYGVITEKISNGDIISKSINELADAFINLHNQPSSS